MNVEEFKNKIQKKIKLGFDFNKKTFELNNSCIKSGQFCKYWDDANWLSTLKKHSQFESCGMWKFLKIKNLLNKN
jgi:hypothetical protein